VVSEAIAAATALFVAGLLAAEHRGSSTGKWICKPLASSGFVALALACGAASSSEGRAVAAALVLSWIGDVCLIPKSKTWFRVGLFAFLLGHLGFTAAFFIHGIDARFAIGALLVLTVIAYFVWRWLQPHVEEKMRAPVLAYVAVITSMVAAAIGAHEPRTLAAALAFYLSDLSVARDTFVARSFVNRAWGLPLYYGAQLLFAWR
jgi:uncharacterized membrane protein YhhN